jgi:pSer/pThr/pTyr-binding forkhead associated (FHA) protein
MKLSLVVLTSGKSEGKVIPITLSQFVIGRDPQCHLRPASALISKRHCAILLRDGKVFLRDFDSTNGTFLNDQPVKGEVEIRNDDRLKVGPLLFGLRVEMSTPPPVNRPTPAPAVKKAANAESSDDESIAAMLLSLQDDSSGASAPSGEVPEGSTVMDLKAPNLPPEGSEAAAAATKEPEKKKQEGNTSSAAKAILEKYMKRPRAGG